MLIQPSYKTGFAQGPGESMFPERWAGLIGAWIPELGPTGNTLYDVSGFGRHGTLKAGVNSTDWSLGDNLRNPGYTLHYPGDDGSEVEIENFHFGTAGTLVMWLKRTGVLQARARFFGGDDRFEVKWESGNGTLTNDFFASGGTITATSPSTVALDIWYHTVFTYNFGTTNQKIYVDTVLEAEGSNANDTIASPMDVAIGNREGDLSETFEGDIGATLFYNRELTAREVRNHYEDTLAPFRLKVPVGRVPDPVGGGSIPVFQHHYTQMRNA
jgi:hypothetical protein